MFKNHFNRIALGLTILTAISVGGCFSSLSTWSPAEPAQAPRVVIDNFTFSPATITITAGTKVTWVNHDDVPHTVTSNTKQFDSKAIDTDEEFSHVFSTPGTYAYFCAVHPHMTGQVIVKGVEHVESNRNEFDR